MIRSAVRAVLFGSGNRGAAEAGGTPYDIGTATTPITSKALTDPLALLGMTWGDSGNKFYIMNLDGNVYQYSAGTAYDITTVVDTPTSFDVSAQEASPKGVEFSTDGTKMYICGVDSHISQYTLTTAWSIGGTVTYNFDGTTAGSNIGSIYFNSAGTKVYAVYETGWVNAQTLGTAWNISTINADGTWVDLRAHDEFMTGIHMSDDGTLMHITGDDNQKVYQFTLSPAFDETTATLDTFYSTTSLDTAVEEITFSPTGDTMYLLGNTTNTVYQVPLG